MCCVGRNGNMTPLSSNHTRKYHKIKYKKNVNNKKARRDSLNLRQETSRRESYRCNNEFHFSGFSINLIIYEKLKYFSSFKNHSTNIQQYLFPPII